MSWLTGRMHKSPSIAIIKYTFELLKPKSYKKYDCHCSTLDGADKKYKRQNIRWWMSWLTGRKHKSQSLNTCEVWKKSFKKYGFHWIFVGAHTFEKRGGVYHICELSPSQMITRSQIEFSKRKYNVLNTWANLKYLISWNFVLECLADQLN